ncbi:MAG: hypothetical protein PVH38_08190 [Gammaproteobacteria bacterium]|jgi:hypothetical protein
MRDIRIPEDHWLEFCESFTRQHRGRLTDMQLIDTRSVEAGMPPEHKPVALFPGVRPLQELRGDHSNSLAELMVTLGDGADETSYLIEDAIALYSRMQGDARRGVRIDSGNGTTTLIEISDPAAPSNSDD